MKINPLINNVNQLITKTGNSITTGAEDNFKGVLDKLVNAKEDKVNKAGLNDQADIAKTDNAKTNKTVTDKVDTEGNINKEDKELKKACQEIEAMFLQELLKEMRATVPQDGLIPDSMSTKIYRDMLDSEISKQMAESPHNMV
jgi:flagellar protein FlgJ